MTEIEGVKDISRQRICTLADAAVENFRNAIRPIYGSTPHGSPEHLGSCIGLCLGGRHYLLTAAHVIDWNEYTSLYIGGADLHLLSMDFLATVKPDGDRDNDHYDFAIGLLSDDDISALSGMKFITENEIALHHAEHAGDMYTAIGYPNSKNKKIDIHNKSVPARLFQYSNLGRKNEALAEKLGVSGKDHIFMDFDPKHSQDSAGRRVPSVKLNGMSGGAIVNLGNLADPRVLAGCVDPVSRLAAVFIEFHADHRAIVATRLSAVLKSIGFGQD